MKKKRLYRDQMLFNIVGGIIVGFFALICLIPFLLIVSGSLSEESRIIQEGYSVLPRGFVLDAYKTILMNPERILLGYRNTIIYTCVGTALGLFITAMSGYVLSRKYFLWRNYFSFFFYFTTLFSGGLVPSYLWNIQLGMKDNPLIIILSGMLSMFNILIMRNFMASVPDAIAESAMIDGANEFTIFTRLMLPLVKPVLATIGLFLALGYWNSWYSCMLYIKDYKYYTLQFNLYNMLNEAAEMKRLLEMGVVTDIDYVPPAETIKLAMTCVVTGPILLLYPFVQRYFVKGITIGAVKG